MIVERTAFECSPRPEDVIRGDVWSPSDPVGEAAIVVCHGFKGFKDWGFFPHLCESLAEQTGCDTIVFNFSGSGIGEDLQNFTDLEKFGHNTFSKELEDLEKVLGALMAGELAGLSRAPSRIGLLGHSRGGTAALITAAERDDVATLVTWAAIASVERYEQTFAADLEADGVAYIQNARTGQMMPMYPDVVADIRANRDRLDMEAAARRLRVPFLIIHGDADLTVPPSEARRLEAAAGRRAQLEIIPGAGHTMGAVHPCMEAGPDLVRAIEVTVKHFQSHLVE